MYLIVLLLMLFTMAIATGWFSHAGVLIDPPSILIVILIPLALIVISGLWRDLKRAFKIILSKENIYTRSELKKSEVAIKAFQTYVCLSGIFGTLVGMVTVLSILDDMDKLLPSISVSMLTLFYSLFIVILLMPIKYRIQSLIVEVDGEDNEV